MVNAPQRRHPKNYPETRRPSKGPRVSHAHSDRLRLLKESAALLREQKQFAHAQAVQEMTEPGGWEWLKRAVQSGKREPLALSIDQRVKDALYAVRDEFETSLNAAVDDGLRAVVEGRWLPPKSVPAPPGTRRKTSLPVNADAGLLAQVREMLPALKLKAGYTVSVSGIILHWLMEEFDVERTADMSPLGERTLRLIVPSPLRDHFVAELDRQGLELDDVMAEGAARVLDGSWTPVRTVLVPEARSDHMAKLSPHFPDKETLDALRAKADELAARSGQRIKLQTVAVAILVDRLGQPHS